jgi:formate dehydrogenase beta subunit
VRATGRQVKGRRRPAPKGRPVEPEALAEVRAAVAGLPPQPALLIEHLHRLQDGFGHLAPRHLVALAHELRMTPAEVYEVATFYAHFDVLADGEAAPPPVTVRVCESLACELAGAGELRAELEARFGAAVRVLPAPCVGRCDAAPVAVVGQNPVDHAVAGTVEAVVKAGRTTAEPEPYLAYAGYRAAAGYRLLAECVTGARSADAVAAEVESAGLRGLGGAGFPASRKWAFVRQQPAPRVMVLNADEGEPGTIKDRWFLERDPHRILEGMLLAAWATGAEVVYIYLRDEYAAARAILERELAALAADPPCPLPRIELRRGAGAYICGEETALIESVEGKRGEPRLRPPFPATFGVFGRPTLVHNVETVYWLREIVEEGGAAFAAQGRHGRQGKRGFSVSGRVARPGVYVAPAGITLRELVDEYAGGMLPGHELYAYLPGGASGGILPASLADVPLDFDVLAEHGCFIGSAAIMVLSQHDSAAAAARNVMSFFAHESCGQCTPCRVGTEKAVGIMAPGRWDLPLLTELAGVLADASICGLGQAAANPIRCVLRHFPAEVDA